MQDSLRIESQIEQGRALLKCYIRVEVAVM